MRIRTGLLAAMCAFVPACGEFGDGRMVKTFERTYEIGTAAELLLDHGAGDLAIIGEDDRTDVLLYVELRTWRLSELRDDDAKDSVVIDVRSLDEVTTQLVTALDRPPSGYHLDVTAVVPSSMLMVVDDDSGDLVIEGIAGLDLTDDSGDVAIEMITGNVKVDDDSGDLRIDGVGGHVTIDDDSGDLWVEDVGGSMSIRDDSGDLWVENVAGDASFDDGSGDMAIIDVDGLVTLRDGSGDIMVRGAGDVRVERDGSGDVSIE